MELFTDTIKQKLIANHMLQEKVRGTPQEIDFTPVVKIFNPAGSGTWLFTEMEPDTEILFGLCDLGMGCPELGSVFVEELTEYRGIFGFRLERDLYFAPKGKSLMQYATEAWKQGRICA